MIEAQFGIDKEEAIKKIKECNADKDKNIFINNDIGAIIISVHYSQQNYIFSVNGCTSIYYLYRIYQFLVSIINIYNKFRYTIL